MKKVFFIMTMAAACMMCMTGCGDDEGVALTGITVTPKTIKLPVGGEQKVTVTAVPADATDVVYAWTSQNTAVATVDNNGIVKIVGVGKTTVTVTSGTFSQTVDVEGTISGFTVKDADGNSSGMYPFNGQTITIALTAVVEPAGSNVSITWTSSATNATVTAGSDGLTATVTLTDAGNAIITATIGDNTATYAISTTSVFESAAGYWTFDDPANLGKAMKGEDLIVHDVKSVPGPSATKNAVEAVKTEEMLEREGLPTIGYRAFEWNHTLRGTETHNAYSVLRTFTVLFDVQPFWEFDWHGASLFYNSIGPVASFQVLSRSPENAIAAYAWGNAWNFDENRAAEKPWYRIVIKVWPAVQGDEGFSPNDTDPFHRDVWVNGVRIGDQIRGDGLYDRIEIVQGLPLWFLTETEGGQNMESGRYGHTVPCSTIAVWDKLLTNEEIVLLGGVSK